MDRQLPSKMAHTPGSFPLSVFARVAAIAMITVMAAVSYADDTASASSKGNAREQLSVGYSLLYQEADGIPKLDWLLKFKDKSPEMTRVTKDLLAYYRELGERMEKLSKEYPALRLDATTMPEIESEERKAIGADQAKDFAPLIGKSGLDFERETLLMFHNALDEQRHLVGVMLGKETDPNLKRFLESTKASLEERYKRVGALLNRRYFVH